MSINIGGFKINVSDPESIAYVQQLAESSKEGIESIPVRERQIVEDLMTEILSSILPYAASNSITPELVIGVRARIDQQS